VSSLRKTRNRFDLIWTRAGNAARRQENERAIADFIRIHQREFDVKLPPAAGRRALLKAQLATFRGRTPLRLVRPGAPVGLGARGSRLGPRRA
jgi:hypothetical protein